jgi:hypothetical protein
MPQSATIFKNSIQSLRIIERCVRAGIGRRCSSHAATAAALVTAIAGILPNTAIAVASSAAGTGGGRRLTDLEEEQVQSHGRIDFDGHIKQFTYRKICRFTAYRKPTS